jgi:hypothetical protein
MKAVLVLLILIGNNFTLLSQMPQQALSQAEGRFSENRSVLSALIIMDDAV